MAEKKFRTGRVGPEGGKSKLTLKLMNVKERGGCVRLGEES